jgi:CRP-like cAMP-binding protein
MTRDPSGQHLVAAEDTDTFEINVDDMEDIFEDSYPIMLAVMRGFAREILAARRRIAPTAGFEASITDPKRRANPLSLVERILFVRNLVAYGRAKVEAIADLALEMQQNDFAAGTVLWREGDPATYSYLIANGVVDCQSSQGHKFRLGPDSVVGSIDSMAEQPRWFTATCETDVSALRSQVAHLIDVIEDQPDMGIDMLRVLARILSQLQGRLDAEKIASERSGDSSSDDART